MMKVIDPVCGMELDSETAQHSLEFEGTVYYFCTPLCMVHFENNPKKFLRRTGEEGKGLDADATGSEG